MYAVNCYRNNGLETWKPKCRKQIDSVHVCRNGDAPSGYISRRKWFSRCLSLLCPQSLFSSWFFHITCPALWMGGQLAQTGTWGMLAELHIFCSSSVILQNTTGAIPGLWYSSSSMYLPHSAVVFDLIQSLLLYWTLCYSCLLPWTIVLWE